MRRAFSIVLVGLVLTLSSLSVWAAPVWQVAQSLITDPQPRTVLRGQVNITGVASHPQFDRYELAYTREPISDSAWVFMMDSRSQVIQTGLLGGWDTTKTADGTYALKLRVIRKDGNYDERVVGQLIVANTRPTETPTPADTPTPTITPTPRQPTPTIVVAQPTLATAVPLPSVSPTPTGAVAGQTPVAGQGTSSVGLRDLLDASKDAAIKGAKYTLIAFAAVAAFFLIKAILRLLVIWLWGLTFGRKRKAR